MRCEPWVTILIVALLTAIIFALAIACFHFILTSEKKLMSAGLADDELRSHRSNDRKPIVKAASAVINALSMALAIVVISFSIISAVYRANDGLMTIDGKTALVIKTGSMSGFYDDEAIDEYGKFVEEHFIPSLEDDQFQAGDLLIFEKIDPMEELNVGDVYGYARRDGTIITHRFLGKSNGYFIFHGDANPWGANESISDRTDVKYHYTGKNIGQIGIVVLFFQSGFGVYSLLSVIAVYLVSDTYGRRMDRLEHTRLMLIVHKEK